MSQLHIRELAKEDIIKGKTIEVLAVLHTSRNPEIWGNRHR